MAASKEFMQLTPAFLSDSAELLADVQGLTFGMWARNERVPPLHFSEHNWKPMLAGDPTPKAMIDAFADYLRIRKKLGIQGVTDIAESCEAPPKKRSQRRVNDPTKTDWTTSLFQVQDFLTSLFGITDDNFCHDLEDVKLAAKMTFLGVAEDYDKRLKDGAAIARAAAVMQRSLDEFTELLHRFWLANGDAIVFATTGTSRSRVRVGVSVMVPITEAAGLRLQGGEMEDMDITAADILRRSRYVHVNAACVYRRAGDRTGEKGRLACGIGLAHACRYQLAWLSHVLRSDEVAPHLISFAGTPETEKSLKRLHFRKLKAKTRVTQKAIMEMGPPTAKDSKIYWVQYRAMQALLRIYQDHGPERLED